MYFSKYHALGNDYIVIEPGDDSGKLNDQMVERLCNRHFGVGSDGLLWGPLKPGGDHFNSLGRQVGPAKPELEKIKYGLRIYNPDGGEAEKSGNGLRIFARFLFDHGLIGEESAGLLTLGGQVEVQVLAGGRRVRVAMGQVDFRAAVIPVAGETGEVLQRSLKLADRDFVYSAATIGNPHCVILIDQSEASLPDLARHYGAEIESHPCFPRRTNVQFMRVHDRKKMEIAIWERGAGYTLASGSSASACAAVARRLDLVDRRVDVQSPGGCLHIEVDDQFRVSLEGAVTAVAKGEVSAEIFAWPGPETRQKDQ